MTPLLNDAQARSVLACCQDLHRQMAELEAMMAHSQHEPPFAEYDNDLSATEAQGVRDAFDHLRTAMRSALTEAAIPLDRRRVSLRSLVTARMIPLHITVAELKPKRLSSYGPLSEAGRAIVSKMQQELDRLIDRVGAYLRPGAGPDLAQPEDGGGRGTPGGRGNSTSSPTSD